jgi:type IV pilus assembly protein PilO
MAINLTLPSDKEGQQKLLLAVLPFIVFGAYWFMMHGKKAAEAETLQTRLEELETKNTGAKTIALTGGPELQQKLALYEQHMKRLEELIPRSEEVASLLNGLAERAMDTNVDLSLMKPETSEPGEFYTEQSYKVQVIGLYHDIGRYLAAIASGPRIVTPVELHLKPLPPAAPNSRDADIPKLAADFTIVTYVIPTPEADAEKPAVAPANTPPAKAPAAGAGHGSH